MPAIIGMGAQSLRPAAPTRSIVSPAKPYTAPSSIQSAPVDLGGTAGLSDAQLSAINAAKYNQSQAQDFSNALAAGNYGAAAQILPSGSNPQGSVPTGYTSAPTNRSTIVGQQSYTLNPNLIDSFYPVANALGLEQQGFGQLDAGLKSARERAIINFGDPSLAQMAGFGLDPQAGAFAQQNYLSGNSTLSRLDKAHQLAQQAIVNRLAAHGILGSGDLGYLEGDENQNYGNGVYDAQQSVLGQLANLYSGYLSNRESLKQGVNTARLSALNDYMANPDLYATLFGGGQNTDTSTTKTPTKTSTTTKAAAPKNTAAGVLRSAVAAGGNATKAASKFVKGSF